MWIISQYRIQNVYVEMDGAKQQYQKLSSISIYISIYIY